MARVTTRYVIHGAVLWCANLALHLIRGALVCRLLSRKTATSDCLL